MVMSLVCTFPDLRSSSHAISVALASYDALAPLPVTTFHETQSLCKSNRHPGIPLSDYHSNAALTPAEQAVQHRLERERKHAHVEEQRAVTDIVSEVTQNVKEKSPDTAILVDQGRIMDKFSPNDTDEKSAPDLDVNSECWTRHAKSCTWKRLVH